MAKDMLTLEYVSHTTLGSEFGYKFVNQQNKFDYVGKPYFKIDRKSPYKGPLYILTLLHALEDGEHGSLQKTKPWLRDSLWRILGRWTMLGHCSKVS